MRSLKRKYARTMIATIMIGQMIFLLYVALCGVAHDAGIALRDIGEKEYLLIKAKSISPRHGKCWHDALTNLKDSCDNLNDREHSLLALRLTNCFLEDSGDIAYDCHVNDYEADRRKCIRGMSDRAFGVYNAFFTQTTNICYFLNQEVWQSETDQTIKQLHRASTRMNQQLLEASEMQNAMLESQRQGLKLQNELLYHGQQLGTVIKSSAATVNDMVSNFKENASEQRELLHQIFSHIHVFQNWIVGEVSWFQSIIFYSASCILCGLFTSSKRTADARITMFVALSFNVVVERMLVQYYNKRSPGGTTIELSYVTWIFRKLILTFCLVTLLVTYYLYKDEQLENSEALKRIEYQLDSMYVTSKPVRFSRRLGLRREQESRSKVESLRIRECTKNV